MKVNDVVYYWKNGMLEEATIFMLGGNEQAILDDGDKWVLKYVEELIHIKNMTSKDWKRVKF